MFLLTFLFNLYKNNIRSLTELLAIKQATFRAKPFGTREISMGGIRKVPLQSLWGGLDDTSWEVFPLSPAWSINAEIIKLSLLVAKNVYHNILCREIGGLR